MQFLHCDKRSRKENSWKLSLNAEGVQGPLNQRSDFEEAMQTCKRLYLEYTAITGSVNKPIPPEQQVRQTRDQQFEGLEEHDYRVGASTGWQPFFYDAFIFVFVITMATKQRLVVSVELGLVEIIIPGVNSVF